MAAKKKTCTKKRSLIKAPAKKSSGTRKASGPKTAAKKKTAGKKKSAAKKKGAAKKKAGKRYGDSASKKVGRAIHEMKRGELKSGRSGRPVKSRKQAIAIGLSEARATGGKVPPAAKKKSAKKR